MFPSRLTPGAAAPSSGTFVLVNHSGEALDFAIWCDKGERLPVLAVAGHAGSVWYQQIGVEAR